VAKSSQQRAIESYRRRLGAQGLARFEVLGRDGDRELIRAIARQLAADGPDAVTLRRTMTASVAGGRPKKGGILAALRSSPLVGAGLKTTRSHLRGRKVDL
jgi:ABC-type uncharacterized transport system substrate-binding protein